MYSYKTLFVLLTCINLVWGLHSVAHAQTPSATGTATVDIMPVKTTEETITSEIDLNAITHPPIRLTPDKSQILRLEKDATTIIVGNPAHLSILADSSRTLILVAKQPGATHFSILDNDGNIVMQRHAIIASPKKQYVRIRNTCAGSDNDACQNTQVYYCPDMCHEIALQTGESSAKNSPAADAAATAANTGQSSNNDEDIPDDSE